MILIIKIDSQPFINIKTEILNKKFEMVCFEIQFDFFLIFFNVLCLKVVILSKSFCITYQFECYVDYIHAKLHHNLYFSLNLKKIFGTKHIFDFFHFCYLKTRSQIFFLILNKLFSISISFCLSTGYQQTNSSNQKQIHKKNLFCNLFIYLFLKNMYLRRQKQHLLRQY